MRRVFMVRYRCKAEHVEHNTALVDAMLEELRQSGLRSVRYAVFKLDPVTFVHLVATESDALLSPLNSLPAYRRLQEGKAERFQGPPEVAELEELGALGVFE